MKFTCSCMVLVENEHQQIELETWTKKIGRQVKLGKSGPRFLIAEANQGLALWLELKGQRTREIFARNFIDCGTNIELFKALAAMNDENDRNQWFIIGKGDVKDWFVRCDYHSIEDHPYYSSFILIGYSKATTEEIIEHFKNRKR